MFNKIMIIFALVIAAAFMYTNVAKAQIVTEGLVSYWTFNKSDIDGETVLDVWGGNDGTIKGDPEIVEGKVGDALKFDGIDDYVDCGNDASLQITDDLTITAWINISLLGKPQDHEILVKRVDDPNREYTIRLGDATADDELRYLDSNNKGTANTPLIVDKWFFVAVVREDNVTFYLDGQEDGTVPLSGKLSATDAPATIGGRPDAIWGPTDGLIDEVCIYNRALSAKEVRQNFAAEGLAVVAPTGKLAETWGNIKASK